MRALVGIIVGFTLGQSMLLDVKISDLEDAGITAAGPDGIYRSYQPMCNECPPAVMIESVLLDKNGRAEFEVPFSERPSQCQATRGITVVGHEEGVEVYDPFGLVWRDGGSKVEGTKVTCWGVR